MSATSTKPSDVLEDDDSPPLDPTRHQLLGRRGRGTEQTRFTLRGLREAIGMTQTEMAERSGMGQWEVSRVERRGDHLVSTLHRYAEAIGGRLEVACVVNGRRYVLSDPEDCDG